MSNVKAANVGTKSSLSKAKRLEDYKKRSSLIADFVKGEYKVFNVATGKEISDFASVFSISRNAASTHKSFGGIGNISANEPRFNAGEGLSIEAQIANELTYSEDFTNADWSKAALTVSADSITAPNGTQTADKITENASSTAHTVSQTNSFNENNAYTGSVFLKKGERTKAAVYFGNPFNVGIVVDLENGTLSELILGGPDKYSIEHVGNDWYRVSITVTVAPSTTVASFLIYLIEDTWANRSYAGDGSSGLYVWGAQIEKLNFNTSYIPTASAQVTRDDDDIRRTIDGEINPEEGTLFCEYIAPDNNSSQNLFVLNDGTFNNRIYISSDESFGVSANRANAVISVGGSTITVLNGPVDTAGDTVKIALSYKIGQAILSVNGETVSTGVSALPVVTQMQLGKQVSTGFLNGNIRAIQYLPEALTEEELIDLTTDK